MVLLRTMLWTKLVYLNIGSITGNLLLQLLIISSNGCRWNLLLQQLQQTSLYSWLLILHLTGIPVLLQLTMGFTLPLLLCWLHERKRVSSTHEQVCSSKPEGCVKRFSRMQKACIQVINRPWKLWLKFCKTLVPQFMQQQLPSFSRCSENDKWR